MKTLVFLSALCGSLGMIGHSDATEMTPATVTLTQDQIHACAEDLLVLFKDGFQWEDIISMIHHSESDLLSRYNLAPPDLNVAIKAVFDDVIDITDTPFLPDALFDPLFKRLSHLFVDLVVPVTTPTYQFEVHQGSPDAQAIDQASSVLIQNYANGFKWNQLGEVIQYSIAAAESYPEATVQERITLAKGIIEKTIDQTDTLGMPDFFVDWIFKRIANKMVKSYFRSL
jgi:hypothetical protein